MIFNEKLVYKDVYKRDQLEINDALHDINDTAEVNWNCLEERKEIEQEQKD